MHKNTSKNKNTKNTETNSILAAARRLALVAGVAIALAACSQAPQDAVQVEGRQAVATTEAPITPSTTPRPIDASADKDESSETATPTTEKAPTPIPCEAHQFPAGPLLSAQSDLNVRTGPGTSNSAFAALAAYEFVDFAYWADNDGCMQVPGNGVWFAVYSDSLGAVGWSHASYLAPIAVDPPDFHGDEGFTGEEDDVHIDCVWLSDGSCVEVSRLSGGWIDMVLSNVSSNQIGWAQLDCVYHGVADACDLLNVLGYGDHNFGLGNSLTQTPFQALVDGCDQSLAASDPWVALTCAELFVQGGSGD